MESKKPLRILCFGDSLTEGYTQHGLHYTPYSDTLFDKLRSNLSLSTRYNISIDTDGMSGDQVTGGFLTRMQDRCTYPSPSPLSLLPFPLPPFNLSPNKTNHPPRRISTNQTPPLQLGNLPRRHQRSRLGQIHRADPFRYQRHNRYPPRERGSGLDAHGPGMRGEDCVAG
jgi:hypothetical protein